MVPLTTREWIDVFLVVVVLGVFVFLTLVSVLPNSSLVYSKRGEIIWKLCHGVGSLLLVVTFARATLLWHKYHCNLLKRFKLLIEHYTVFSYNFLTFVACANQYQVLIALSREFVVWKYRVCKNIQSITHIFMSLLYRGHSSSWSQLNIKVRRCLRFLSSAYSISMRFWPVRELCAWSFEP